MMKTWQWGSSKRELKTEIYDLTMQRLTDLVGPVQADVQWEEGAEDVPQLRVLLRVVPHQVEPGNE